VLVAACALAAATLRPAAAQHITVDGRFSPGQTLVGPNYSVTASLGKQVGSNLFHSFGQFGLSTGETATFSGAATVSNVISRVTGGSASSINGQIKSNITGANLYLINPSGLVFGPNATINVSGSFHASTADYLKMADGTKFQATNPDGSTLSAAPPAAFGFLTATPAQISVNGSTLGPVPGTLGLVGGPVSIVGATLSAPAGTIHVASAAATGEVPVDPRDASGLTVTSLGPVVIKGGSTLDVSDPTNLGSGGSVFMRSGNLTIDASTINADNYGAGAGGTLVLRGDSQVALSSGASVHAVAYNTGSGAGVAISTAASASISADSSTVMTRSTGPGSAGPLSVETGQLALSNGAEFASSSQGTGNGGSIGITAGSILLDGRATQLLSTGIASATAGPGTGGSILVNAGTLTIFPNAEVATSTSGSGNAGNVLINSSGALSISGRSAGLATVIGSQSFLRSTGNTGTVTLNAGSVSISDNGVIATTTFGSGDARSVSVSVGDALSIDGTFASGPAFSPPSFSFTGIGSVAPAGTGNVGAVTVRADNLSIRNNGLVGSGTFGPGSGGSVSIAVGGALFIDGSQEFLNGPIGPATGILSGSTRSGDGGPITVTAGTLTIVSDGRIFSGSLGSGNGGAISVNVSDLLSIDSFGSRRTSPTNPVTGISAAGGVGNAGTITVAAGALSIRNGLITSSTLGAGNAGSVSVKVDGQLTIDAAGGNPNLLTTGIVSNSNAGSTGNAGDVSVAAGGLSISNGGTISSSLLPFMNLPPSTGNSGRVAVNVGGLLSMTGSGSRIGTETSSGSTGNAGSVLVSAEQATVASGAEIVSTTAGTGAGGSVTVRTRGALVLDGQGVEGTQIAASTIGLQSGPGGSVTVQADTLTIEGGAQIASSTAGPGKGGDVNVIVTSDLMLPDPGPQITAQSTGSGDAGSVAVSAFRVQLGNGAAISTEAETSTANGGNITLSVADLLYLTNSQITTSVKGQTGNGGNITIDPQFVVLNRGSSIISQAIEGHGGNITIDAGEFLKSSDSIVSASSEVGISGTIEILGPRVDLNGALVALPSNLRGAAAILREGCAAPGGRPRSNLLVQASGRLPQDPDTTLRSFYLGGEERPPSARIAPPANGVGPSLTSALRLSSHCE
jgi:filamentous hemagglutinin family protein